MWCCGVTVSRLDMQASIQHDHLPIGSITWRPLQGIQSPVLLLVGTLSITFNQELTMTAGPIKYSWPMPLIASSCSWLPVHPQIQGDTRLTKVKPEGKRKNTKTQPCIQICVYLQQIYISVFTFHDRGGRFKKAGEVRIWETTDIQGLL